MRDLVNFFAKCRVALAASLVTLTITSVGCVGFAANIMHAIYGNDIKPEFQGLKDQRIAILCADEAGYFKNDVTSQVAANLRTLIGNKLPKATIVRQEAIEEWLGENGDASNAVADIGRGVKADYVISVDMRNLRLKDGQTLYRGKVDFSVDVFSPEKNKTIFRKQLPEFTYPQAAAISTTEMDSTKFQRLYLMMASERVSRIFVPSPMGSDIANDAKILQFQ